MHILIRAAGKLSLNETGKSTAKVGRGVWRGEGAGCAWREAGAAAVVVVIPQITLLNPICSVHTVFGIYSVSLCKCQSRLIWYDGLDL